MEFIITVDTSIVHSRVPSPARLDAAAAASDYRWGSIGAIRLGTRRYI